MTQAKSTPIKQPPTLRKATTQDAEAIARLGAKVFTSTFGYSIPASDLRSFLSSSYSPSAIAEDISNPLIEIIIACSSDDSVLGFAQLTEGTNDPCVSDAERPIELQRFYVDTNHHGGGIGRALVNEVERIAMERGFKTLWLGVWEENLKSQKVYERFGFRKIGEHDFVMGTCVQRDWILKKAL